MPLVPRTYSAAEVALEASCPEDRVHWLTGLRPITPDEDGRFTFGAVLVVKMASGLLESGVSAEAIERAAAEGFLRFQRTDEYLPHEPGPRSRRTFAEFQASAGPRAELLPAIIEVLGLPKPDPGAPIHRDEEELFERFLDAWSMTPDEDALLRAARLMAQGARAAMLGWVDLQMEQVAEPARERLMRGELEEFPDDVRVAFTKVTHLAPEMFTWLSARYLEHRSVNGIVEGFERFLASKGMAPIMAPPSPPGIVFVDLSSFTRLTRERGDESAVVAAMSLQRLADALTVVDGVARALDAAHAKGLVHRDVKPANVLIARSTDSRAIEHVYLTDFGLTKRSASRSGLTGTGVFVGTLEYAAPEQFEGKPLGPQTDVYSLGCVLFECLTGEPPFRRQQDAAVMYAHLHDPPPSATTQRPELPRGIDQVIEKAMAKRPVDRYAAGARAGRRRQGCDGRRPTAAAQAHASRRRRRGSQ